LFLFAPQMSRHLFTYLFCFLLVACYLSLINLQGLLGMIQCRKLLAAGRSLYQCHSDGISSAIRRMYHQYKPKDRPTLQETTQALDPLISRDVLLFRYEEPFKVQKLFHLAHGAIILGFNFYFYAFFTFEPPVRWLPKD